MIVTPFFPALRARLAAQVRRSFRSLRQLDFPPLIEQLRHLVPAELLASQEKGPGCRDRVFSLRLTFECFVWQMLKPKISCREVVRAVQARLLHHAETVIVEGGSYRMKDQIEEP